MIILWGPTQRGAANGIFWWGGRSGAGETPVTPPTPTPDIRAPSPASGGVGRPVTRGPYGRAFPEYKSTLEHYQRQLASEERQEQARQLEDLAFYFQAQAAQQASEQAAVAHALIAERTEAVATAIEAKAQAADIEKRIAEVSEMIATELRRRDDEEAIVLIMALI